MFSELNQVKYSQFPAVTDVTDTATIANSIWYNLCDSTVNCELKYQLILLPFIETWHFVFKQKLVLLKHTGNNGIIIVKWTN